MSGLCRRLLRWSAAALSCVTVAPLFEVLAPGPEFLLLAQAVEEECEQWSPKGLLPGVCRGLDFLGLIPVINVYLKKWKKMTKFVKDTQLRNVPSAWLFPRTHSAL